MICVIKFVKVRKEKMQLSLSQINFEKNYSTTNDKRKTKNKGIVAATCAKNVFSIPTQIAAVGIINLMQKTSKLEKKDSVELEKAIQKGLKDSKLYEKGVRAYTIKYEPAFDLGKISIFPEKANSSASSPKNATKAFRNFSKKGKDKKALRALKENFLMSKAGQKLEKYSAGISDVVAQVQSRIFKNGTNACYLPKVNKIITPDKVLRTSAFHEMGHALNNSGGILMKTLQKMRPLKMLAPVILAVSLFNKRKANEEDKINDTKTQKTKNFIKRNAGKLTALTMAPMVLEETIASLRGQNIAKKLTENGDLSKALFKKIKILNTLGFASYFVTVASAVISTVVAIKIKDRIQEKQEEKFKNSMI